MGWLHSQRPSGVLGAFLGDRWRSIYPQKDPKRAKTGKNTPQKCQNMAYWSSEKNKISETNFADFFFQSP